MDALRTRAGVLLAAASLVTTFFGGQALEGDARICGAALVAIVAFLMMAGACMVVLLPWKFEFSLSPTELIKDYIDVEERQELPVVLRDLAIHYKTSHAKNRTRMEILFWSFRIAVVLLGLEVTAWLIAL